MANFRPKNPFNVPMKLLVPINSVSYGAGKKSFPAPADVSDDYLFFGSFRTFGGSEYFNNNVYTVIATATIQTWYRPDIKANCRICLVDSGDIYEIKGEPEDINYQHQYLQIKVQKVGGKA